MKLFFSLALSGSLFLGSAPVATAQQSPSPYRTSFLVDGSITAGLTVLTGTGLYLVQQKSGLTPEQLAALDRNDVPKIDRFAAGNYDERAQTVSDLLCYPTLLIAPGLLALNPEVRGRYGQVLGLYLQTMLATDAMFTMTVGNVYRYRPYLYGTEGGGRRSGKIATNSFFAGHTAHTATATFFAAKVFHDFNPGSTAEPFVWGAAALVPAAVGYYRLEAGKHFLTDNIVGYAVGATMGIVVPQLHKAGRGQGVSMVPMQGVNVNGYSYSGLVLTKQL
ncbi:phosphatase PAP2 family protein [Hymenobacter sp. BT683]|uniref:Phosphatase PAP2 family protein n=1 Tax=Hymenobacter jeongseonensis TaxID=2791027 RepID=A0ABS0IHU7_9BACT|nr:phosphatase PAP2 family protein [Hymenobacter jeongseonensis]MBF9237925.1 phosphatase PAP2 family protein [Hymenobacter jeongseonensis]